jgi:hypothetical protein
MRHESATLARFENKQQMRSGEKNAPKKAFPSFSKKVSLPSAEKFVLICFRENCFTGE